MMMSECARSGTTRRVCFSLATLPPHASDDDAMVARKKRRKVQECGRITSRELIIKEN